jgi:hypothetical protein
MLFWLSPPCIGSLTTGKNPGKWSRHRQVVWVAVTNHVKNTIFNESKLEYM